MKNIKIYLLCIIMPLFAFTSCYEDKGNYDYIDLHEITIDTSGNNVKAAYSVSQFETLNIPVKIQLNGNEASNLRYEWSAYPSSTSSNNKATPVILSEEQNFNQEIALKPDSYTLLYTVIDKTYGVKEQMKFGLTVTALLKSGWMVFYEDESHHSDVAIIHDKAMDNTIVTDQVIYDMFSKVNGRKLSGSPVDINHTRAQIFTQYQPSIYIFTENEGVRVDDQNFLAFGPAGDWFYNPPEVEKYQLHTLYAYAVEILINNGRVHYSDMMVNAAASDKRIPVDIFGDYYAEPYLVTNPTSPVIAVFYDRTNKKFRYANSSSLLGDYGVQSGTPPFDCRNIGMDMLYMETGFNNLTLALFQSDTGRVLLTGDFRGYDNIAKGAMSFTGDGTSDAKFFTVGGKGPVFLYANETSAYTFDYASATTSATKQWEAPSGETITCMKLFKGNNIMALGGPYPYNPNTPYIRDQESKLLFIATYNNSSKQGFVYRYNIDPTSGNIDPASEVKYSGFGRIKVMAHKGSNKSN